MSTNVTQQVDAFSRFVEQRLPGRDLSLEECLAAYRVYQSELSRLREAIAPAVSELEATGGTPLDIDAIISEGKRLLAAEAIAD